jgi:hypothetical protein
VVRALMVGLISCPLLILSNSPIPAGGSYTYNWAAWQAGTFWVHSHKIGYEMSLRTARTC